MLSVAAQPGEPFILKTCILMKAEAKCNNFSNLSGRFSPQDKKI